MVDLCKSLKELVSAASEVIQLDGPPDRWSMLQLAQPGVSVKVGSDEDVAQIVKHCTDNNVPFFVRNGGNGFAVHEAAGGVQLDVTGLNGISVLEMREDGCASIKIQAGVTVTALRRFGSDHQPPIRFVLPQCNTLGYLGAALGGGVANSAGVDGMVLDHIESMRVCLASGEVVEASEKGQHADLFWAMKGAGPNVGVVLSANVVGFTAASGWRSPAMAALHSGAPINTSLSTPQRSTSANENRAAYWQGQLIYHPGQLEALAQAINDTHLDTHSNLHVNFLYGFTPGKQCVIVLSPRAFIYENPPPADETHPRYVETLAHAKSLFQALQDVGPVQATWTLEPFERWNVSGDVLCDLWGLRASGHSATLDKLDVQAFKQIYDEFAAFATGPSGDQLSAIWVNWQYFPTHTTALVTGDRAGAYPWRSNLIYGLFIAFYKDKALDNPALEWGEKTRQLMRTGRDEHHVYINFARGDEAPQEIYGASLPRLRQLKAKYDPQNTFRHWFPLKPAGTAS